MSKALIMPPRYVSANVFLFHAVDCAVRMYVTIKLHISLRECKLPMPGLYSVLLRACTIEMLLRSICKPDEGRKRPELVVGSSLLGNQKQDC